MPDFDAARLHMIDGQILPSKVTDARLVAAMGSIAREEFVPKGLRGVAYVDEDLEVAPGRYLMEPMVFARLLQDARIDETCSVLDIGCASGYSTAVLGKLAGVVVALESDDALATRANESLASAGVDNVAVMAGDFRRGLAEQGPYDIVIFEGAIPEVPGAILDQLAEGGRLVAVTLESGVGKANLFTKLRGVVGRRELFDANIPLLPGFEREEGFVF